MEIQGQFASQGLMNQTSHREIVDKTLIEFTHAWYKRDDHPPSVSEAINWKDRVIKANPEIQKVIFIHGHVHVQRHQIIDNLTILCQGATGLPFDRDKRGSVAFLTVNEDDFIWDVNRYEYDYKTTSQRLDQRTGSEMVQYIERNAEWPEYLTVCRYTLGSAIRPFSSISPYLLPLSSSTIDIMFSNVSICYEAITS